MTNKYINSKNSFKIFLFLKGLWCVRFANILLARKVMKYVYAQSSDIAIATFYFWKLAFPVRVCVLFYNNGIGKVNCGSKPIFSLLNVAITDRFVYTSIFKVMYLKRQPCFLWLCRVSALENYKSDKSKEHP